MSMLRGFGAPLEDSRSPIRDTGTLLRVPHKFEDNVFYISLLKISGTTLRHYGNLEHAAGILYDFNGF